MAEIVQRIVIGTAQWGLDYGITNTAGRLTDARVTELVEAARQGGIDLLDTAPAYGDAEQRIAALASDFRVQTKVSAGGGDVLESLESSTQRLGRPAERILVHDWHVLSAEQRERAARDLGTARERGLAPSIGVSAYSEPDLVAGGEAFEVLDLVQVPVSVLDQRLVGSPVIAALRARGTLVQARSVYLQGLAAATTSDSPLWAHVDLVRFREACARASVTPAQACRAFIRSQRWVDEVVVGLTTLAELDEWAIDGPCRGLPSWESLASDDLELIDPRRWTAQS